MEPEWIPGCGYGPGGPLWNLDAAARDQQRLERACQEFEAIFLHEILKGLRRTIPGGESRPEAIYRSLFDEHIARVCSKRSLGLADLILSRLSQSGAHDERGQRHEAMPKDLQEKSDNLGCNYNNKKLEPRETSDEDSW